MSNLKRGRPPKNLNVSASSIVSTDFDIPRFAFVLKQLGGNVSKWSLKNEWILFHKTYFNTSSTKLKHARSCYDFYRRHTNEAFWKYSGDVNSYEITKQALKFVASEQKDITTIRGIENDDVPPPK